MKLVVSFVKNAMISDEKRIIIEEYDPGYPSPYEDTYIELTEHEAQCLVHALNAAIKMFHKKKSEIFDCVVIKE